MLPVNKIFFFDEHHFCPLLQEQEKLKPMLIFGV